MLDVVQILTLCIGSNPIQLPKFSRNILYFHKTWPTWGRKTAPKMSFDSCNKNREDRKTIFVNLNFATNYFFIISENFDHKFLGNFKKSKVKLLQ